MSNYWNGQLMLPAPELIASMTGSNVLIGALLFNPVKIIFDNQSSGSVILYFSNNNGINLIQWHTFPTGEAIVLDEDLYSFPIGTQFYANGAGTGNFSVSYCYLKQ